MTTNLLEPRKALNKAFLKIKPSRSHIEDFKTNLIQILDSVNEKESEEFHKNLVIDFLKKTYYDPNYSVNTKGRNDLVIHNGKDAKTTVGVIIEAKSPVNKTEMITVTNLNGKALQELVLYYMRERITHKNTELKHLVVTNIYEWFVFDAQLFNKLFAEKKSFVKQFIDFEEGRLSGKDTKYFYNDIAKPFIESLQSEIVFAHFDIRKYDKPLRNVDKEDDKLLVALFKLLSPEHLLKLSFANDSNSLDKNFYSELLRIIGLTEVKEGGKKLIQRHKKADRNSGSLLENAIVQLDSLDKISRLQNAKQYGDTNEERLFTVALELTITWINRILFLKLLEAQLITYHKGDRSYSFLNGDLIADYDSLNSLFFQVLAKKPDERIDRVKTIFAKVPYLNSSLFEPTDLEHETLFVSQLEDHIPLKLLPSTVIKDAVGKKETGLKDSLNYFFSFLDAYDFASEGSEDIQEDNKTLINASVLGLIFEKINGYKDGSFFTPSFITMYMCKETIRKAVVQKFNETKNWNCIEFEELYDKIEDRKEANTIINSLKICDPAVGSGHFLVSALNEIIAIKNDLRVLQDHSGNRIKEYHFEVVNDELIVTDEDGIPYSYNPKNKESQRIQETLFHEKQTIIENCLFGVDINPNSVKICRLRLWIELLKNAYYRANTNELETLPNIDINIKCGNSLISRFDLDADLKKALKQSKWNIESYKLAVSTYRNAESKEQKREMERLITDIKGNFRSEIGINDPKKLKLEKLKGELFNSTQQTGLFERSKKEQTEWNKRVNVLAADIKTLDTEIEEIKLNKIYENAFEWRFEFPDVLNDEGDFVGFDAVIGNPPYGMINNNDIYFLKNYKTLEGRFDLFEAFIENGLNISKNNGILKYILPNTILTNLYSKKLRQTLVDQFNINEITNFGMDVFDEATVHTCIIGVLKNNFKLKTNIRSQVWSKEELDLPFSNSIQLEEIVDPNSFTFDITLSTDEIKLFEKINRNKQLKEVCHIRQCIKTGNDSEFVKKSNLKLDEPWKKTLRGKGIGRYSIIEDDMYLKYGDFLARNWKNTTFYETPKIAIRETGNRIIATLDTDNRYFLSSLYAIYPKEKFEIGYLKYLLGIINSNFATFYIRKIAFDLTEGAFTKVRTNQLGRLPIPNISKEDQQLFIEKVNEILFSKSQDPKADTLALEQEIDAMVYELYGLSEEEIKIVENS
ncbi:Eco57I restriction-modification methylase domain-containing protein [Flavobacterium sp.]|uniref:DUF7149 domain-containing protein n=1 Tax=Flavobacterium sp. TaxID=239 RepID=UPI003753A7BE